MEFTENLGKKIMEKRDKLLTNGFIIDFQQFSELSTLCLIKKYPPQLRLFTRCGALNMED